MKSAMVECSPEQLPVLQAEAQSIKQLVGKLTRDDIKETKV